MIQKRSKVCKPKGSDTTNEHKTGQYTCSDIRTKHKRDGLLTTETNVAAFSDSGPSGPDMVAANDWLLTLCENSSSPPRRKMLHLTWSGGRMPATLLLIITLLFSFFSVSALCSESAVLFTVNLRVSVKGERVISTPVQSCSNGWQTNILDGGVPRIDALHGILGYGLQQMVQLLVFSGRVAFNTARPNR